MALVSIGIMTRGRRITANLPAQVLGEGLRLVRRARAISVWIGDTIFARIAEASGLRVPSG
jgi:hypothetical protein